MIRATDSADVAIGSRYCPGGAIVGWSLHRRLLSRMVNRLTRTLLRLPVSDSSGAFRAYRVAALREIDLDNIQSAGYAYLEEILWHLDGAGVTFLEVPIIFRERRAGRSKINLREAAGKLAMLLQLACRRKP